MLDTLHAPSHTRQPAASPDRKLHKDLQAFGGPRRLVNAVDARKWCARCISAAFPGQSVEAIANDAAGPLLTSPRTIRRILTDKDTTKFDGGILARAQAYCVYRGVDPIALLKEATR